MKAVAAGDSVETVLDGLIAQAMRRHAWALGERGEDPVASILRDPDAWNAEVAKLVRAKTGLDGAFSFEAAQKPQPIKFSEQEMDVTVKRSYKRLKISYGIELELQDDRLALRSYYEAARVPELIKEETRRWFSGDCEIDAFCFEQDEVRRDHQALVQRIAEGIGYRVAWYSLELVPGFTLPEPRTYKWAHSCRIRDWNQPVQVEHHLFLRVESVQKFLDARIQDIEAWLQKHLRETTEELLFDLSYCDLATCFKATKRSNTAGPVDSMPIEEKIKARMSGKAREVGCEILQHSSTPNIEPIQFLDHLDLGVQKLKLRPKDGRDFVEITLATRGRLLDLKSIEDQIRPDNPLVQQLRKFLATEARHYLYGVTLREFYLGFDVDGSDPTEPSSCEERLSRHLEEKLRNEFAAECTVTVHQEETDFVDRWLRLQEEHPTLTVRVRSREREPVEYSIAYHVVSVSTEHWSKFVHKRADVPEQIQSISQIISDHLMSLVDSVVPVELLKPSDNDSRKRLEELLFHGIEDLQVEGVYAVVERLCGVRIEVSRFTELDTLLDEARDEVTRAEVDGQKHLILGQIAARVNEAEILRRLIKEELAVESPDEERLKGLREEESGLVGRKLGSRPWVDRMKSRALPEGGHSDSSKKPDRLEAFLATEGMPVLGASADRKDSGASSESGRLRAVKDEEYKSAAYEDQDPDADAVGGAG